MAFKRVLIYKINLKKLFVFMFIIKFIKKQKKCINNSNKIYKIFRKKTY